MTDMMKDKRTIGFVPEKELFNKSTLTHEPLIMMQEDKQLFNQQRSFFEKINELFNSFTSLV